MKILLVNPTMPFRCDIIEKGTKKGGDLLYKRFVSMVGAPLGLNDIAGMLTEEEVMILDQNEELYVNNFDYSKYNAENRFKQTVAEFQPDVIGFTCITAQVNSVKKLIKITKNMNKNIFTVLGGLHPSARSEDFIDSEIDIIVIDYGKVSFYQLIQEYKKNKEKANFEQIRGLAIKNGDKFFFTKPTTECSLKDYKNIYYRPDIYPNRKLTDKYEYRHPKTKLKMHYISTAIGCTHKCNFCYLWKMTGGRYIHRDVDSIIDELRTMDNYPLIRFCDANTFGDIKKAEELFTKIIDEKITGHYFIGDVRAETITRYPEVFKLAKKAGLVFTIIGLEATSDEELRQYNKKSTIKDTEKAMQIFNDIGIHINGNYIIRPDYDEKDFERVAKFVENHPIFFSQFTILTPFPGTEQWDLLKDQIINYDYDYYNLINAVVKTKLPEKDFYEHMSGLYEVGAKSTIQYFKNKGATSSDSILL